jgi:hypothetical protein
VKQQPLSLGSLKALHCSIRDRKDIMSTLVLSAASTPEEMTNGETDAAPPVPDTKESKEEEAEEEEDAVPPPITEEERKKYANWPLKDIKEPHPNDVLYGRGGT